MGRRKTQPMNRAARRRADRLVARAIVLGPSETNAANSVDRSVQLLSERVDSAKDLGQEREPGPWVRTIAEWPDDDVRWLAAEFFRIGEVFLSDIALAYGFDGPVPALAATSNGVFDAAGVSWVLQIDREVIAQSIACSSAPVELGFIVVTTDEGHRQRNALITFLWVLAHEFVHVGRAHGEVLSLHPGSDHVIEYDADLLAAKAVVRFVHTRMLRGADLWTAKRLFVYSIFWPIRSILIKEGAPENSAPLTVSKTHPAWVLRLNCIVQNVAHMENFDRRTERFTERFLVEGKELGMICARCEGAYAAMIGVSTSESAYAKFLVRFKVANKAREKLINKWERMRGDVARLQLFRRLSA